MEEGAGRSLSGEARWRGNPIKIGDRAKWQWRTCRASPGRRFRWTSGIPLMEGTVRSDFAAHPGPAQSLAPARPAAVPYGFPTGRTPPRCPGVGSAIADSPGRTGKSPRSRALVSDYPRRSHGSPGNVPRMRGTVEAETHCMAGSPPSTLSARCTCSRLRAALQVSCTARHRRLSMRR